MDNIKKKMSTCYLDIPGYHSRQYDKWRSYKEIIHPSALIPALPFASAIKSKAFQVVCRLRTYYVKTNNSGNEEVCMNDIIYIITLAISQ